MNSNNPTNSNRLIALGDSDYKISDGQPNIKGWKVKDADGLIYGEVDELLFNPASRKVRYMVVDTDENNFDLDRRKILVPIGLATLHEQDDDVYLDSVSTHQLQSLPSFVAGREIDPNTESNIRQRLRNAEETHTTSTDDLDDDFYNHEHFNEERFYGNRTQGRFPIIEEQNSGRELGEDDWDEENSSHRMNDRLDIEATTERNQDIWADDDEDSLRSKRNNDSGDLGSNPHQGNW
jgi:hypothetical protein